MVAAIKSARVPKVVLGSPAECAGIRADDVIVSMDGSAVTDGMNLFERLQGIAIGSTTTLVVQRDGSTFEVTLTVEAAPATAPAGQAGPPLVR